MYKHILVPTDGSARSAQAARAAARLAAKVGARITAVYVKEPVRYPAGPQTSMILSSYGIDRYNEALGKAADRALAGVKRAATAAKVKAEGIAVNAPTPWRGIVDTAQGRKCDLIVMASHGRRGLDALLVGSETQKVLTHSKTPVLVYR